MLNTPQVNKEVIKDASGKVQVATGKPPTPQPQVGKDFGQQSDRKDENASGDDKEMPKYTRDSEKDMTKKI